MGRVKELLGLELPPGAFYREDVDMSTRLEESWRTSMKGDRGMAEEILPHARIFTALREGKEVTVPPELQGFLGTKLKPSEDGAIQTHGGVPEGVYVTLRQTGEKHARLRREREERLAEEAKEQSLRGRMRRGVTSLAATIASTVR